MVSNAALTSLSVPVLTTVSGMYSLDFDVVLSKFQLGYFVAAFACCCVVCV